MPRPRIHPPGQEEPAAARLARSLEALRARGGRVVQLRLEAQELAALQALMADGRTMREAIAGAILAAAAREPG